MNDLQKWIDHARLTLDFWLVAYYPFHIKRRETGLEDLYEESERNRDHNVFFLENDIAMKHPMDYKAFRETYRGTEAIAIPHHVSYELGSRGKNWDTNDEAFSPFAEIYSSHGCSENDTGPFDMERHLHMDIDFSVNGSPMGAVVKPGTSTLLHK